MKMEEVLGTKKKMPAASKKRAKPLAKYMAGRLKKAKVSDNGKVLLQGFIIGAMFMMVIAFIAVGIGYSVAGYVQQSSAN